MGRRVLRDGDRIVCLGDSITADLEGYVTFASQVIRLARPDERIDLINAGAGGNTAAEMLARFDTDVLRAEPTWVTIHAGANDALRSVSPPQYARAVTAMIERAGGAGIRVGLMTPARFEPHFAGADVDRLNDQNELYDEWLRMAADKRGLLLIPVNEMCRRVHDASDPDDPILLTHDGIHMSPTGRYLMGLTFLAAFGFSLPVSDEGDDGP